MPTLLGLVEESREKNQPKVDMSDSGISNVLGLNDLFSLFHITQLVLSHNKYSPLGVTTRSFCLRKSGSLLSSRSSTFRGTTCCSAPRTRKLGSDWSEACIQSREQSLGHLDC
uniref:Uncharacterized protein n=1 Tax=Rhinolophus ferrumequinum TaxID=59479 RepID=A0A671F8Z6_RHIFE